MPPPDALDGAERLALALERAGVPCAIGGALCLALWGVPRATRDADLNVFVREDRLDDVIAALRAAGCEIDSTAARARVAERGDLVASLDGLRVDLFVAFHPLHDEVAARRVGVTLPSGAAVWMLADRDLVLFKVLFGRTKDWADIERIAASRGARLDARGVLADLARLLDEGDPRLARLRALLEPPA